MKMENIEKRKQVAYTLPEAMVKQVREEAKKRHLNMSVFVQLALEEYLRKEERNDK